MIEDKRIHIAVRGGKPNTRDLGFSGGGAGKGDATRTWGRRWQENAAGLFSGLDPKDAVREGHVMVKRYR